MEAKEIKVNEYYYYGNCIKKFKCVEIGETQSWFEDYKKENHQFYNHDMYINKRRINI